MAGSTSLMRNWLFAALALFSGPVAATNYFSWGVETPANTATVAGVSTSGFWVSPWASNTTQDCTVAKSGSCSRKMVVIGNDGGNQQAGPDVNADASFGFNAQAVPNGGSLYYRAWVRFSSDFSWGASTAKTKISRAFNGSNSSTRRFMTPHVYKSALLMAECEYVAGFGGGCLTTGGSPGNDYNIGINYDFTALADNTWHEHIVRIKPNSGSTSNAEMQLYIDGTSVGTLTGWRLIDNQSNAWMEAWGGIWARPYWQLGGTASDGGTVWVDDISTDDAWNSTYGGSLLPGPSNFRWRPAKWWQLFGDRFVIATSYGWH